MWQLVAAVLCTIGAAITTTALVVLSISEPTTVNELAAIGAGIGTLGGLAWIIAAAIEIGRRPP